MSLSYFINIVGRSKNKNKHDNVLTTSKRYMNIKEIEKGVVFEAYRKTPHFKVGCESPDILTRMCVLWGEGRGEL